MMILCFILCVLYAILIFYFSINFKQKVEFEVNNPHNTFSIIIPFRNEEEHLTELLMSIQQLKYPSTLFEVILVDDHSFDSSLEICNAWKSKNQSLNISILQNSNTVTSPKKSAVLTALNIVSNDYILTTDADCVLPEQWLHAYDKCIQHQAADMIAGPVKIEGNTSFWSRFQVLDMLSLQVIGLGSFNTPYPLFCNAANLCYKTSTLLEINAFETHKHLISGDDVFNLEVFHQQQKKLVALVHHNAIVCTNAEKSFKALTHQRIRWASKAKYYKNKCLILLGLVVFFTNLSLVCTTVLAFLGLGFQYFYLLWVFKCCIDFYSLLKGDAFFKTGLPMAFYLVSMIVYPFVSSYFALLSFNGKFTWKARNYKV